ncbi:MAG: serine/threonine protein kinase [Acidobacteria bacterium]|nr:serine/threonine protein kinase [Acidobacteriota bacterium]
MSTLTPEQWKALGPYLDQALTLSGEERVRWLESLRAENLALAVQVQELLDRDRAAEDEGLLENSPVRPPETPGLAGQTVGAYRLISAIGHGGMGTVWLAERNDGRFQRKAAVKFLSAGLIGQGGEQRFKREGAILARLANPNIAELLDAGVTATGQPYLILDYVEGEPIDRYCDERALDVRARIRLFLDVVAAVAHAHSNLIVHRDIKPSNVMVNKEGQVKLLDFGIAKLLEGEGQEGAATLLTREGGSALTPEYAAPEQITGGAVTTATDVYGLGVLLYVLLSGQHPAGTGPRSPAELLKAITEKEPQRPSEAVAADRAVQAASRGTTVDKLRRQLRGDLDTIVLKSLKKNPQERYASVTALADDLGRYLRNEPIRARPDTMAYRAAKFVRRNRAVVALATMAVFAVVAGLAGVSVQARRAFRERDRASRITEFMTNMFKVSDPSQARGNSITAREILDKAAKDIETGLARDPEAQAQMMYVMGEVYDNLGLYAQAEPLVQRAADLQEKILGADAPAALTSKYLLGRIQVGLGRLAEAERLQRETLSMRARVLGPEHPETLRSMSRLGSVLLLQGRVAEAEKLQREALAIARRVLGPEHPETLLLTNSLVSTMLLGRNDALYPEAEKLQREALPIELRVWGLEHIDTLNAMMNLGLILGVRGQYAEAEKLYRQILPVESRLVGPASIDTITLRERLAFAVASQGRYQEATDLYSQVLSTRQQVLGRNHPHVGTAYYNLACLAAIQNERDRALALLEDAVKHGLLPYVAANMDSDVDLKSLHGDPRFTALVARAKKNAVAVPQPN